MQIPEQTQNQTSKRGKPFNSDSAKEARKLSKKPIALRKAFDRNTAEAIVAKVKDEALTGNIDACRLFMQYHFGTPPVLVNQPIPV